MANQYETDWYGCTWCKLWSKYFSEEDEGFVHGVGWRLQPEKKQKYSSKNKFYDGSVRRDYDIRGSVTSIVAPHDMTLPGGSNGPAVHEHAVLRAKWKNIFVINFAVRLQSGVDLLQMLGLLYPWIPHERGITATTHWPNPNDGLHGVQEAGGSNPLSRPEIY